MDGMSADHDMTYETKPADGANTEDAAASEVKQRLVPLTVRFNADAYETIRAVAAEKHLSAAELVRVAVDGKLDVYLGTIRFMDFEQGEEIHKSVRELFTQISKVLLEINKIGVNYNQTVRSQNAALAKWEDVWEARSGQMTMGQKMQFQMQKEAILEKMELDRKSLEKAIKDYTDATKGVAKELCRILT